MRSSRRAGLLAVLSITALPARAQLVELTPVISGNEISANIIVAGLTANLTITFEQAVGLNLNALSLSARVVTPLSLLGRMPSPLVGLTALPILVRVEPTPGSTLSFSGVYKISLYTNVLTLGVNSPLRLYRGPVGGPLRDMTGSLEMGSVRAGGSGPGFSEFLIVADLRPLNNVILEKLNTLSGALTANASSIDPAVHADLAARVDQIRDLITTGATVEAIDAVKGFMDAVKQQSGAAIPDVWQANSGIVNVAGTLRSFADTLRFELVLKSNQ